MKSILTEETIKMLNFYYGNNYGDKLKILLEKIEDYEKEYNDSQDENNNPE